MVVKQKIFTKLEDDVLQKSKSISTSRATCIFIFMIAVKTKDKEDENQNTEDKKTFLKTKLGNFFKRGGVR